MGQQQHQLYSLRFIGQVTTTKGRKKELKMGFAREREREVWREVLSADSPCRLTKLESLESLSPNVVDDGSFEADSLGDPFRSVASFEPPA